MILTAFFVWFPTLYHRQESQSRRSLTVTDIGLEHYKTVLTPTETMRLLYDQGANSIYTDVDSQLLPEEILSDCRTIIQDLFGSEEESIMTKILYGTLEGYTTDVIQIKQCMTLYNGEIVILTLVSVWFDWLYICYEQNSLACVELSLYEIKDEEMVLGESNAFTDLFAKNDRIFDYYISRGLEAREFNCYAYNMIDRRLAVIGLYGVDTGDPHGIGLPIETSYPEQEWGELVPPKEIF